MSQLNELGWPQIPAGNRIRYIWQEWLQNRLEDYQGGYLLSLDSLTQCLSMPDNVFDHHIKVGASLAHSMHSDPESLPILTDSLQSVIISHALEYTENPSVLLGEIQRCLAPQGVMYAVVYARQNPWSWKSRFGLSRRKKELPLHNISRGRLDDWLGLLGFKTLEIEAIGCSWWRGFSQFERKSNMSKPWLSAPIAYMIKAEKKVSTMTPIMPKKEKLALAMGGKLVNVSNRTSKI